jgi:hypothetical protein
MRRLERRLQNREGGDPEEIRNQLRLAEQENVEKYLSECEKIKFDSTNLEF